MPSSLNSKVGKAILKRKTKKESKKRRIGLSSKITDERPAIAL